MRMWRWLLMPLVILAPSGCGGDRAGYTSVYDHAQFYPDDWVYYDDDDEVFLAGLTDEQKDELKRRWDALPPEEQARVDVEHFRSFLSRVWKEVRSRNRADLEKRLADIAGKARGLSQRI